MVKKCDFCTFSEYLEEINSNNIEKIRYDDNEKNTVKNRYIKHNKYWVYVLEIDPQTTGHLIILHREKDLFHKKAPSGKFKSG